VRHGIWLAASLKFLVPFALLVGAGSQMGGRPSQSTVPIPAPIAQVVEVISLPFTPPPAFADRAIPGLAGFATGEYNLASALIAAWLAGASVVLLAWFVCWRRVAALVKVGDRVVSGPVFESLGRLEARVQARPLPLVVSRSSFEPGVFGIVRPVLLWPDGIEARLTGEQVDGIIAHEVVHVRRHDNLVAALHMLVQAVCWFHPLVWWIGSRLLDERERACDEAVVAMGSDPRIYAESILRTCQWYIEAPRLRRRRDGFEPEAARRTDHDGGRRGGVDGVDPIGARARGAGRCRRADRRGRADAAPAGADARAFPARGAAADRRTAGRPRQAGRRVAPGQ
jgi:beta-lactamase regulating signal transducer with metallopeptidase domain